MLGNLLGLKGFDFESSQQILSHLDLTPAGESQVHAQRLNNSTSEAVRASSAQEAKPVSASIYQLDGLVRRAPSLQQTADARAARDEVTA